MILVLLGLSVLIAVLGVVNTLALSVTAFDLATGSQVWRRAFEAPYRMNPAATSHGKGPNWMFPCCLRARHTESIRRLNRKARCWAR